MGADQPILLEPRCPAPEDPVVLDCLRMVKALCSADWVELSLEPEGPGEAQTFQLGKSGSAATSAVLGEIGGFSTSLRIGSTFPPNDQLKSLFTECLRLVFDNRRLGAQAFLLRAALDVSSDFILLFDESGNIAYANPTADALLSLQTEDELLADCEGYSRQPLFTLLCRLAEHKDLRAQPHRPWTGVIQLVDGRRFEGKVRFLEEASQPSAQAVMIRLKTAGPETESRIEDFSSTHGLSPREQEVLQLLVQGRTTVAMADKLGISPHTVRDHLKHLYRKTGTGSRSELLGLISRQSKR